jgi:hypothetical protein
VGTERKHQGHSERLFVGRKRTAITVLAVGAVFAALVSAATIPHCSFRLAVSIYVAWILVPPSWFFVEWVWLFESRRDPFRLEQFKVTVDLAQKFWGAVLLLLGSELYFIHHISLEGLKNSLGGQ